MKIIYKGGVKKKHSRESKRFETWRKIGKDEVNEIEKIQGRALKRIFNLPASHHHHTLA